MIHQLEAGLDELSVELDFDSAAGFESAGLLSEDLESVEPEAESPAGLSLEDDDEDFEA